MTTAKDEERDEKISDIREREEEDLAMILSEKYGLPYVNLSRVAIDLDSMKILPEDLARDAQMVIFGGAGRKIKVAVRNINNLKTKERLEEFDNKGFTTTVYLASDLSLKKAWERYTEIHKYEATTKGTFDISEEKIDEIIEQKKGIEEIRNELLEIINSTEKKRVSEILEIVLGGAILNDASDIHIEPQETDARLRWRLDGVLHDFVNFDTETHRKILSRIKLLSGMKLNIKNQAQDGRFAIKFKDTEMEIRSSIIPQPTGESIVMRILNPKNINVPIEEMGIEPHLLEILNKEMEKPNGMVLTTGPTGSGKTTALYAFLKKVYNTEVKIITLEDPVEYHVAGIVQTQINEKGGYTFAAGLRAILRQDPDIIMVGEIRDSETAKTAVNAALTGHLVLSTLHTNNAAGVIPRLLDLGIDPNVLPPALNVAMAQRLLRRLCQTCKAEYTPEEKDMAAIKNAVDTIPPKFPEHPDITNVKFYKPVGCPECKNIGYKGRIGIYEAILIDEEMTKLIVQKPGEAAIMAVARNQGMLTMQQDGVLKILKGITDLDELRRVVEL